MGNRTTPFHARRQPGAALPSARREPGRQRVETIEAANREALRRMDFRDAHTMALQFSLPIPCDGLNHMDFAPDGRTAVASCEFDGQMLLLDMIQKTRRDRVEHS